MSVWLKKGWAVLLAAFVLAGCGGTGSSSTDDGTDGGGGNTDQVTISLEIVDGSGAATQTVTPSTPATIRATVRLNGNLAPSEVVTFDTTLGALSPESGTALTDANGVAEIALLAGDTNGAGTVTATVDIDGVSGTDDIAFQVSGAGGGSADAFGLQVSLVDSLGNPISSIGGNTPGIIRAVLTNGTDPVVGQVVTFSASLGRLDPASGTSLTNDSGVATVQLFAGTIAGAGAITASVTVNEQTIRANTSFSTNGDESSAAGLAVSLQLTDGSGNAVTNITQSSPGTLEALVTRNGAPLVSQLVEFSSTIGELSPVTGTALTNASGVATISLLAGDSAGAGSVTAEVSNGGDNATASLSFFTDGSGQSQSEYNVTVQILDGSGNPTSSITSGAPGTAQATVTRNGAPVANAVVSFSATIGELGQASALTNASGIAQVSLVAGSTSGAGTVTARTTVGSVTYSGSANFSTAVTADSIVMDLTVSAANVSAGGTTTLSATLTNSSDGSLFVTSVPVSFTSSCINDALSVVNSPVSTSNGIATSTYRAQGCEGDDLITASTTIGGAVVSDTVTVNVAAGTVNSIRFVSATPQVITIRGTGGIETSTVIFEVVDAQGNPVNNRTVSFSLNTEVGGLSLNPTTATTDADGRVQTVVTSGTVATSVRVTATESSANVSTQSSELVVSTGIPDQDSFSISASTLNVEGWNHDGVSSTITVRLSDAFNNPVPDGTAVNFITEGGQIQPSCTTSGGACSVIWTSSAPRPTGAVLDGVGVDACSFPTTNNLLGQAASCGQPYGGRVTILAYAIGEESFPDINTNGVFDTTEEALFAGNDVSGQPYDLAEAFVDYNEDGVFGIDAGAQASGEQEEFVNFDNDNPPNQDEADGEYNGVLCGTSTICSTQESVNVRGSIVLVMSGSGAYFNVPEDNCGVNTGVCDTDADSQADQVWVGSAVNVIISDLHNQPMPAGTTVEFSLTGDTGELAGERSYTWLNDNHNGGQSFGISVLPDGDATLGETAILTIKVTTPRDVVTIKTLQVVEP